MLKARFWNYSKEYNSTAHPTTTPALEVDIELKAPTDILNPTLLLSDKVSDIGYNYCYLPKFKRYYRVSNWTYAGGYWQVTMSVDVLASWRDDIGRQNLYVLRSSSAHNGAIMDNTYVTTADIVKTKVTGASLWESGHVLVVGVLSGHGGTIYYEMQEPVYNGLIRYIFSEDYAKALVGDGWVDLYPQLKAQTNPLQYITGVMYMPRPSLPVTGAGNINIGWVKTPYVGATVAAQTLDIDGTLQPPTHPQASTRGRYLNYSPYTEYTMFVPAFGSFPISAADIFTDDGSTITYHIRLDPRTGHATLELRNTTGEIISNLSTQVGVPLQVSQVYNRGNGIGQVLNVASGAVGIASGIASKSASGVMSGITGLSSAIGDIASGKIPSARAIGSDGSLDSLAGNVSITGTFYPIIDEDLAHRGRPLCQKRTINTLSGFVMCADADVRIPATDTELDSIRQLLEEGIIYV